MQQAGAEKTNASTLSWLYAAGDTFAGTAPDFERLADSETDKDISAGLNPVAFVQMVPAVLNPEVTAPQNLSARLPLVSEPCLNESVVERLKGYATFAGTAASRYCMQSGAILFAPQESDLRLNTCAGEISIARGCQVLVQVKGDYVSVFNLHDRHSGQVTMRSTGTVIDTVMGKGFVIGPDHGNKLSCVNPAPEIALRNVQSQVVAGGQRLFTADFSIMSALMNHPVLQELTHNGRRTHKKEIEQLLKNALVLACVTSRHGVYKR